MDSNNLLRLTMASGAGIAVSHIRLYPQSELEQILTLRAKAEEELGGFSSGLGFLGSPGWVIGGAAALGAIESIVSSGKRKKGLVLLRDASMKYQALKNRGTFFAVSEIDGINLASPSAWTITAEGSFQLDLSIMGLLEKGEAISRYGIKRTDIDSGIAKVNGSVRYVQLEEDFIWIRTSQGPQAIRWSLIESYCAPDLRTD